MLSHTLFAATLPPSLCLTPRVCGSVWLPWVHTLTQIERGVVTSMREVHGCVMKPIITGWKTGIVHAIDKSLSVMSAVFCQRPVFLSFFFFSLKAMHLLLLHANTKASLSWIGSVPGDNAWFAFYSWIWQVPLTVQLIPRHNLHCVLISCHNTLFRDKHWESMTFICMIW